MRVRRDVAITVMSCIAAGVVPAQRPSAPPAGGALPVGSGTENPHGPSSSGLRVVEGRVERLTRRGAVGVGGIMVMLHRVGPDRQGPVDSLRTSGRGDYRFRYRASGNDRAIYFVSASWAGIAYFTPPLKGARVSGDPARITVYDTASIGVPLHVRGRHVIVSAIDIGDVRTVIEVFEVANDSTRTVVGRDSTAPTWTAAFPGEARGVAMGQGEVSADAAAVGAGRLRHFAPFAPGLKQFSFSYTLPQRAFPLTIPVGEPITVLEVLIEDPHGSVGGAGLREVNPVADAGRTFKRFLAQEVPASAVMTIGAPVSRSVSRSVAWLASVYGIAIGVGAALLTGLAGAAWRRGGGRRSATPANDPAQLAREIADLDAAVERGPPASADERAEYERVRAGLKERLTRSLARGDSDA